MVGGSGNRCRGSHGLLVRWPATLSEAGNVAHSRRRGIHATPSNEERYSSILVGNPLSSTAATPGDPFLCTAVTPSRLIASCHFFEHNIMFPWEKFKTAEFDEIGGEQLKEKFMWSRCNIWRA